MARLEREDTAVFRLVRLRYFAGLSVDQAAAVLGISLATAYRHWNYARVWLHAELLTPRRILDSVASFLGFLRLPCEKTRRKCRTVF